MQLLLSPERFQTSASLSGETLNGAAFGAYASGLLCFHSSDMESKPEGGSLTSEQLAAIEDEEVLNKMVRNI